jgi:heme exporter protein D
MVYLQVLVRQPAAALGFFAIFLDLALKLSLLGLIIKKLVRRL